MMLKVSIIILVRHLSENPLSISIIISKLLGLCFSTEIVNAVFPSASGARIYSGNVFYVFVNI
jgi:hypothetical protein